MNDEPKPDDKSLQQRVADAFDGLSPAERGVAAYMRDHPYEIAYASAEAIGNQTGTSDATVIRTVKALGYAGLPELRRKVAAALVMLAQPSALLHRRVESLPSGPTSALDRTFGEAIEMLEETRRLLTADRFAEAVEMIASARTTVSFGMGPSRLASQYLTLRLTRLGLSARTMLDSGYQLADGLLGLAPGDVVVIFAPAELFRELEVILDAAGEARAKVILISDPGTRHPLAPKLVPRVAVSLHASLSASGAARAFVSAVVIVDALVLALAATNEPRALETSKRLNSFRAALMKATPAAAPPPDEQGAP
jgi:DNA-binding MurR/RpiR family transcriptional regulator